MKKICKQQEHKWETYSVGFIHGNPTGLPYRWKCTICGVIGKLYGNKRSKILPLKENDLKRQEDYEK